ncbi:secreted RxLR effector protein 161-like [Humulus lupulus]|uniref:secreted RxLR effector protein 161-like n=1 Tax=Humulus lupulus TaxID=3486 RepID=UPI002B415B91|nr:secreted RxLR effector protein 161-like [Humulus lupulus]
MHDSKSVSVPLRGQFVLSKDQSPKTIEETKEMAKVPYVMALGCLMYIMVSTRPEKTHALSILSRFMSNPGLEHWNALKWLLRYLKGTTEMGLRYKQMDQKVTLEGFVGADYAASKDTRRSTTSYVFTTNGDCICWKSQLQLVVSLSTTEAEFMATTEAFKEAIWLQGMLQELKMMKDKAKIYSDSQSPIHLCKNPVYHEKRKHIDILLFWIREKIEEDVISLDKIGTEDNLADIGTKALHVNKFKHCLNLLNLRN